ncbi:glycine zipper 2TM domain-containing protein [Paraburkholderia sp.]|jgi:outer membrane lipoprotein SlyB|uniref:glycine zipper 2TM domain-containing protein n=1 Tax=Paraburkholderia sp. TaxID=1926495 RepID=UPI000EFB34A0|nr:glycine zipper 2TM domain-containing protein [Paraburkholderia sp.]
MDNPGNTQPRRIHPLVATAAGAVIIASLAATAAITGLFPKASSNGAQTDQTQAAQVTSQPSQQVVDSAAPANPNTYAQQQQLQAAQGAQAQTQPQPQTDAQAQPAPAVAAPSAAQAQYAQQQQPDQSGQYAQQPPPQQAYCASCGTVVAISAVRQEGHGTGVGAVGGAVVGGLVGNQFGGGVGRGAMTVLGAVGGGFAGNSVEKHLRSTTAYSVHVRMESGKNRYFTYHEAPPFQQGEHVHLENGALVAG